MVKDAISDNIGHIGVLPLRFGMVSQRLAFSPLKTKAAIGLIAVLVFSPSINAVADEQPLRDNVNKCLVIANDGQRLACFDSLDDDENEGMKETPCCEDVAKPIATNIDDTPVSDSQLGDKYLERDDARSNEESANFILIKTHRNDAKLWVFEFENGQVWQQLESRYLSIPNKLPAAAQISSGVFGTYNLRIGEEGRITKIKRIR
jgi:hypothetical protein